MHVKHLFTKECLFLAVTSSVSLTMLGKGEICLVQSATRDRGIRRCRSSRCAVRPTDAQVMRCKYKRLLLCWRSSGNRPGVHVALRAQALRECCKALGKTVECARVTHPILRVKGRSPWRTGAQCNCWRGWRDPAPAPCLRDRGFGRGRSCSTGCHALRSRSGASPVTQI